MTEEHKKAVTTNEEVVTFPILSKKTNDYLDNLNALMGKDHHGKKFARKNPESTEVSFPLFWLKLIKEEARQELFRELEVTLPSIENPERKHTMSSQELADTTGKSTEKNVQEIKETVSKLLPLGACNREDVRLAVQLSNYYQKNDLISLYRGMIHAIQQIFKVTLGLSFQQKAEALNRCLEELSLNTEASPATKDDLPAYVMFYLTHFTCVELTGAYKYLAGRSLAEISQVMTPLFENFQETLKELDLLLKNYTPPRPAELKTNQERESVIKGTLAAYAFRIQLPQIERLVIRDAKNQQQAYKLIKEGAKEAVAAQTAGCEGMAALTFMLAVEKGYTAHFCYLKPLHKDTELRNLVILESSDNEYFIVDSWGEIFKKVPSSKKGTQEIEKILSEQYCSSQSKDQYKPEVIYSLKTSEKAQEAAKIYLSSLKVDKSIQQASQQRFNEVLDATPKLKEILYPSKPKAPTSGSGSVFASFGNDNVATMEKEKANSSSSVVGAKKE